MDINKLIKGLQYARDNDGVTEVNIRIGSKVESSLQTVSNLDGTPLEIMPLNERPY